MGWEVSSLIIIMQIPMTIDQQSLTNILDREERWFERGVKEAIYVKRERPSLNRGGGLRVHLSPSYNAVIAAIPQLSVNGTHGH